MVSTERESTRRWKILLLTTRSSCRSIDGSSKLFFKLLTSARSSHLCPTALKITVTSRYTSPPGHYPFITIQPLRRLEASRSMTSRGTNQLNPSRSLTDTDTAGSNRRGKAHLPSITGFGGENPLTVTRSHSFFATQKLVTIVRPIGWLLPRPLTIRSCTLVKWWEISEHRHRIIDTSLSELLQYSIRGSKRRKNAKQLRVCFRKDSSKTLRRQNTRKRKSVKIC